jgi:hypothetical protein
VIAQTSKPTTSAKAPKRIANFAVSECIFPIAVLILSALFGDFDGIERTLAYTNIFIVIIRLEGTVATLHPKE